MAWMDFPRFSLICSANSAKPVPSMNTTICELWATMSPAQALGFDGDRVPLGQRGEGPHRPDSLIGPLAQRPTIRTVTIPAGGLRYTPRHDIMDIYEALDRDCSGPLSARWRRTIRPHSRCCMNGEEVRIDHATREVYKYSELRSTLSGFAETAAFQWWTTMISAPGDMSPSILKETTAAMASRINRVATLLYPETAAKWQEIRQFLVAFKMRASPRSRLSEDESTWELTPTISGGSSQGTAMSAAPLATLADRRGCPALGGPDEA